MSRRSGDKRVAVLGSELDGLIAALALVRRGVAVTLIEEGELLGGTAAAVEIAPGFRAPVALDRGRLRADLLRRLKIPAEQLAAPPPMQHLVVDGTPTTDRTAGTGTWLQQLDELTGWARRITHKSAPPLDPRDDWRRALSTGIATRLLGKRRLRTLIRAGSISIADWITEFTDDGPEAASLAAAAIESSPAGPMAMGSGLQALLRAGASGARAGRGLPALLHSLEQAAQDHGVDIRRGAPVQGLHPVGDDWIVHMKSHEAIEVDAVVGALPPQRLFLELLQGGSLPVEMVDSLRSFRTRGEVGVVLLATDSAPPERLSTPGAIYQVGWRSLAAVQEAADEFKYGRMVDAPPMDLAISSLDDPSLAPAGGGVIVAHVRYCPPGVEEQDLIAAVLAGLRSVWPEAAEGVVASRAWTPADLERDFRLPGGHLEHGEWALDQLVFLRPDSRCRGGATPLPGLSICGPGCHPGIGLHGGSALWAAQRVGG